MFTLACARGRHRVVAPAEKLLARGSLPGAYGYDLAAQSFASARAQGISVETLLAPALPVSWMVNNRAPATVFYRWLNPPFQHAFRDLLEGLAGGPEAWLDRGEADRVGVTRAVSTLSIDGQGAAAVSKVLAVLVPETVPLMDDAAIAFALDAVAMPTDAEHPTVGPGCFVPMLDWFARAVLAHHDVLGALARDHAFAVLTPAQVLDRLLWFESWGWRLPMGPSRPRWQWVGDGNIDAVVRVHAPTQDLPVLARVDLATAGDAPWAVGLRREIAQDG